MPKTEEAKTDTGAEETALATSEQAAELALGDMPVGAGFASNASYKMLYKLGRMFCASSLVPKAYRGEGKLADCMIALEMAIRGGMSPLLVMQNLYDVNGNPSWSAKFILAAVNLTGKFSPVRFRMTGEEDTDARTCVAWATEKATGETLDSPPVSIAIAKKEGWYGRNGSKWQTMPELMLRYRAATFFGRLYAPEVLMGIPTREEMIDITPDRPADPIEAKKLDVRQQLDEARKRSAQGEPVAAPEPAEEVAAPVATKTKKPTKGGLSKVELQHLDDAIEVVGIPPELVAEHCGKNTDALTAPEYRGVFDWLVAGVCETVGWASADVENEITGLCGSKKEIADLTGEQFRALIEKMRGDK